MKSSSAIRVLNSKTRAIDNNKRRAGLFGPTHLIARYSEFHASFEAIIRRLPEKRLQSEIYEKLKTIHTGRGAWLV